MSFNISRPIKDACAVVASGTERGTGYLVDERHVVTCEHVVRSGPPISVQLSDKKFDVIGTNIDADADCAVLELAEAVAGIEPLQIVAAPSALEWMAFGFQVWPVISDCR